MLPICILAIRDDDDRAYMTRLFVKYQRLTGREHPLAAGGPVYPGLFGRGAGPGAGREARQRPHGPDPGQEKGPPPDGEPTQRTERMNPGAVRRGSYVLREVRNETGSVGFSGRTAP